MSVGGIFTSYVLILLSRSIASGLKSLGNDAFLVIYGGGDTDMAAIKIQVEVAAAPNTYRNRTCLDLVSVHTETVLIRLQKGDD